MKKKEFFLSKVVWLNVLIFRIICAIFNNTFYHPDEYYQSLEVAHRRVYGFGFKTWEWTEELRSSFHPMIFCFIYKILNILHLDDNHCNLYTKSESIKKKYLKYKNVIDILPNEKQFCYT
jgi:hypothetical protein